MHFVFHAVRSSSHDMAYNDNVKPGPGSRVIMFRKSIYSSFVVINTIQSRATILLFISLFIESKVGKIKNMLIVDFNLLFNKYLFYCLFANSVSITFSLFLL